MHNDGESKNDTIELVWGGEEIARVIGRTPRVTFQLLERGLIPARKIKGRWVASKPKLLEFFMGDVA
ncbi:DNA-binding protein [Rhizobium sp. BR 250]